MPNTIRNSLLKLLFKLFIAKFTTFAYLSSHIDTTFLKLAD